MSNLASHNNMLVTINNKLITFQSEPVAVTSFVLPGTTWFSEIYPIADVHGEYAEVAIELPLLDENSLVQANLQFWGKYLTTSSTRCLIYLATSQQLAKSVNFETWWVGETANTTLGLYVGEFYCTTAPGSFYDVDITDFIRNNPSPVYYMLIKNIGLVSISIYDIQIVATSLQTPTAPNFTLDPPAYVTPEIFIDDTSDKTITVTTKSTEVAWTAATVEPWLTISDNAGTGNGVITYAATDNTGGADRTAVITVTDGILTQQKTVVQYGTSTFTVTIDGIEYINPIDTHIDVSVPLAGRTIAISIITNRYYLTSLTPQELSSTINIFGIRVPALTAKSINLSIRASATPTSGDYVISCLVANFKLTMTINQAD